MLSVRIETYITKKLNHLSRKFKISKSQIVKEALQVYLKQMEKDETPFELGKDLFGQYSSNSGTKSTDFKNKVKDKLINQL